MTYPTQKQMDYLEGEFFSDERNTRISFDRVMDVYNLSDQSEIGGIIEGVCTRLLSEYNAKKAVYSYPCKEDGEFIPEHGRDNVERAHGERGLTWYDITDGGITRKVPGLESDFIEINYKE